MLVDHSASPSISRRAPKAEPLMAVGEQPYTQHGWSGLERRAVPDRECCVRAVSDLWGRIWPEA